MDFKKIWQNMAGIGPSVGILTFFKQALIKLRLNRRSLQIFDLQVSMAQLPGRTNVRRHGLWPMAIKTIHVFIQE